MPTREIARHHLAQQILSLISTELHSGRERICKFDNSVVEQRDSYLKGVCHTCPIYLGENVVDQVSLKVKVQNAREEIATGRAVIYFSKTVQGIIVAKFRHEISRKKSRAHRPVGYRHRVQVCFSSPYRELMCQAAHFSHN